MAQFKVQIDNILGGISPTQAFGGANQFDSSIGIDPDMPITDSSVRTSGLLRPTAMNTFSSSGVTGAPLFILTNPKDAKVYVYMSDGNVVSYNSALASETVLAKPTSGAGNGAFYYDNYLYFSTPTDISRYGPMNGSPSLTNNYWTSTLSKTALVNTTYPTVNSLSLPNHIMHYHGPTNNLYFVDVVGGKGTIHFISTTKSSVEGDTNNGSTYAKLTTTPYGYLPTCMETYGSDLAIGCVQGTDATLIQKNATILFWDTVATSPNKTVAVGLPDPLVTAMKNVAGVLYVWLGNAQGGTRVIKFVGGYSWQEVAFFEESYPPLVGAVDHWMNKIVFGGNTTYPETSASVWSVGSKNAQLASSSPIHNILRTQSGGNNGWVTALKYVTQADNKIRQPICGWKDGSGQGIDNTTTGGNGNGAANVWRSATYRVGKPFQIKRMRIPLAQTVASNMILTAKFYVDELTASTSTLVINNTNYNGNKNITKRITNITAKHSFILELRWTGNALMTVSLPIIVEGEILKDVNE